MTSGDATKRVLIISAEYSLDGASQWLPEELAREFASRGHHVRVVARDMIRPRAVGRQRHEPGEPEVFSVGVTRRPDGRLARRVRLPLALLRQRFSALPWAAEEEYDLVIYFTIAWTSSSVVRGLQRRGAVKRSVLVLWDFFPVHQYSIGHIPGWLRPLEPMFYRLEARAVAAADTVAVMSGAGNDFLARYFPRFEGGTVVIPPWGQDSHMRAGYSGPFRAVFGGQLGAGRGLEDLLGAAEIVQREGSEMQFAIYGDGPLLPWLQAEVERKSLRNVTLAGKLPRAQYLEDISQASVGIAATVRGVPSPSFPSKIVDYARIGLPVVASVEESTDVGRILESNGAGWAARAGHPEELAAALLTAEAARTAGLLEDYGRNSRLLFEKELDVRTAVDRFLGIAERHAEPTTER